MYVDKLIVCSECKYVRSLRSARDNGLVFNSEKCAIGQERIHFFGIVYEAKGDHPDPERVEDIRNTPAPKIRHVCNNSWG